MKITTNCNKCHSIEKVIQFHIDLPYSILILECNHRVKLYIPKIIIEQDLE